MTLALIILVVFLIALGCETSKRKKKTESYKKSTITNVSSQDKLDSKNFLLIINDLNKINNINNLSGSSLIDAIEELYHTYDLPDRRTEEEKLSDRNKYINTISDMKAMGNYPEDDSILSLEKKIWHYPFHPPLLNHPELLNGAPNSLIKVDNITYKYDFRGIATGFYRTIPAKLIGDINILLTTRDLSKQGFNHSWDRQESLWQQCESSSKSYKDKKAKYPWLYK